MCLAIVRSNMKLKLVHSLFVQKPYLGTVYKESNIEEDFHMKKQNKINILIHPISGREAASKIYVDTFFNDSNKKQRIC